MLDTTLSNLANVYRRRVLLCLLDHNPQSDEALSIPEDITTEKADPEELQIMMHHNHLPRLEAAGFITWQKDDGTVVKGPKFVEIKPLLELLADNTDKLPDGDFR